jgi:hypothetical protein
LSIVEPVDAFLARLGITAKFAKLTRPNGSPVWVSGAAVSSARAPLPDEYVGGINAVLFTGSLTQGIKESLVAAIAELDAHGGKL